MRLGACHRLVDTFHKRSTEEESNTRFVLTFGAAGGTAPEIASAKIASGASAPPAVSAPAVSGAAPLRARTTAQGQIVSPLRSKVARLIRQRWGPCIRVGFVRTQRRRVSFRTLRFVRPLHGQLAR